MYQHYYPGEYRGAHWPTADGVVPFTLFWLMVFAIETERARVQLDTAMAVAHGENLHAAPKDSAVKRETRRLEKIAFPKGRK